MINREKLHCLAIEILDENEYDKLLSLTQTTNLLSDDYYNYLVSLQDKFVEISNKLQELTEKTSVSLMKEKLSYINNNSNITNSNSITIGKFGDGGPYWLVSAPSVYPPLGVPIS